MIRLAHAISSPILLNLRNLRLLWLFVTVYRQSPCRRPQPWTGRNTVAPGATVKNLRKIFEKDQEAYENLARAPSPGVSI
jgi:hypothetical protein